ncbi:protein-methionine-sulfoxide reductase catalytic subunit MsrP [Dongia sp.]|uniref:protein-methionine-sulfoxide reductase catalytic subunit MsrP n=1 Tax=Dongia sp. TaxID=1977262 RepID=UPI003752D4CD
MFIKIKRGWELPESAATPEGVYLRRRHFLAAAGIAVASPLALSSAHADDTADPSAGLYPVKRNETYKLDREVTSEGLSTHYNNYYEFDTSKDVADLAQALPIRPWTVTIDGMVEKPQTLDIDALLKQMPLEERLYRHRCVEAWSMAVPWSGFPLKRLVDLAAPLSSAKYLRFESFNNPDVAPGISGQPWSPWPYIEGLTIAEATNDLAFMVTGMYGKPAPKQNGAPLRLATPWKYGFKSAKGIVKITFTDQQPLSYWEQLQSSEYGFWANVNPEVAHPRWSQADERVLGQNGTVPTQLFNGYGEFVASLYSGMQDLGDRLYR